MGGEYGMEYKKSIKWTNAVIDVPFAKWLKPALRYDTICSIKPYTNHNRSIYSMKNAKEKLICNIVLKTI